MHIKDRITAFEKLGTVFLDVKKKRDFEEIVNQSLLINPWFTKDNIEYAFVSLGKMLRTISLNDWLNLYIIKQQRKKLIGVIVPGNIPLVGFYDFLCVLMSGNIFVGKLSSSNNILLPFVAKLLCDINVDFKSYIFFEDKLENIDLLIATGSDNSVDYFNALFAEIPKILRKNRNSIAVLTGGEDQSSYNSLSHDIFMYFGLGCRSVSKLFLPHSISLNSFKKKIESYSSVMLNKNYRDNYNYQKSILNINSVDFLELNNSLLVPSDGISSPISVLYYQFYESIDKVNHILDLYKEQIQCVVSDSKEINNSIPLGSTQDPSLLDFPDGVDVFQFILDN